MPSAEPGGVLGSSAAGSSEAALVLAASGQRFGVIYADPPWPFNTWSPSGEGRSAVNHYRTDAVDEIVRLPVAALAADDCVLLLWCTGPHIAIGTHVRIIEAWGFRPSTIVFDWIKQNSHGEGLHTGMGYWSRSNAEPVILATKGSPRRFATDVHQIVMAPVGEHSAKPEEVRRRIERLFAGPYLELYARRSTPGWTCWGNEIPRNALREQAAPSAENDVADQGAASLSPPSSVDDDLSIPDFLHRSHPGAGGAA
jgi:N6-adenosine-specific RNA methylase IME4